jgi:hypothetical protein
MAIAIRLDVLDRFSVLSAGMRPGSSSTALKARGALLKMLPVVSGCSSNMASFIGMSRSRWRRPLLLNAAPRLAGLEWPRRVKASAKPAG